MLQVFIAICFLIFSDKDLLYGDSSMKEPIYCKYSDAVVDPFCEYLKKTYDLHCYGNGGGFINNINNIQLNFGAVKNLSVAEARVLIIECTQELLRRINEDEQVRPYLSHYPFTEKGLSFIVSLDKKNGDRVDSDFVSLFFTSNGMIHYYVCNGKKGKEDDLKKIHQEPYQKAVEIVAEAKALEKERVVVQKEEMVQKKSSKIEALCQYIEGKFKKF